MASIDISIFILVFVISFSGILINIFRRGDTHKVIFTRDNSSLFAFRIIIPCALVSSILIYLSGCGHIVFHSFYIYAGYLLVFVGLIIRWIAVFILGNAFTVRVSILKDQRLKTNGIYKKIRHPSYTGLLLYYLGLGVVMQNWICVVILVIAPVGAVLNRIKVEEAVLISHFGEEYRSHILRSYKIIPFIY